MSSWEDIEDLLYRAITNGRSPRTEGFHNALRELRAQVPTVTELAQRLGFPRRTVGDWLNRGTMPRGARADQAHQAVLEALRRHRLRLGRERRLRAGRVHIVAVQRYTDDDRIDNVRHWHHPAQLPYNIDWNPAANGQIIDAYLAGDMRGAAEAFVRGIGDLGYQEMTDPDLDPGESEPFFDIDSIDLEGD